MAIDFCAGFDAPAPVGAVLFWFAIFSGCAIAAGRLRRAKAPLANLAGVGLLLLVIAVSLQASLSTWQWGVTLDHSQVTCEPIDDSKNVALLFVLESSVILSGLMAGPRPILRRRSAPRGV
jgi:hypothetical protein